MENKTLMMAVLGLCLVYFLMPLVMPSRTNNRYRHQTQSRDYWDDRRRFSEYQSTPDPLENINDMARNGVSMDQIQNSKIDYVI